MKKLYSVFTGTGSYVPSKRIGMTIFTATSSTILPAEKLSTPNEEITQKFGRDNDCREAIAEDDQVTSIWPSLLHSGHSKPRAWIKGTGLYYFSAQF